MMPVAALLTLTTARKNIEFSLINDPNAEMIGEGD
jgi:hypothetical protein